MAGNSPPLDSYFNISLQPALCSLIFAMGIFSTITNKYRLHKNDLGGGDGGGGRGLGGEKADVVKTQKANVYYIDMWKLFTV